MAAIFYFHWNEAEALATARALRAAGHTVDYHATTGVAAKPPPNLDAWVISLVRLPSHGRAYAEWLREARARDSVQLVFVGGAPDQVAATRARFPNETYCSADELPAVLDRLGVAAPQRRAASHAKSAKDTPLVGSTTRPKRAPAPRRAGTRRTSTSAATSRSRPKGSR